MGTSRASGRNRPKHVTSMPPPQIAPCAQATGPGLCERPVAAIASDCIRFYLSRMDKPLIQLRGRGTAQNPANRLVQMDFVPDYDELDPEAPGPGTVFLRDATRSIIARND